jgi:hypothetical protein
MMEKPKVCVIDENVSVKTGWEKSLSHHASLDFFRDHTELMTLVDKDKGLIPSYSCIIMGRLYPHINLDIVNCSIPESIRGVATGPLFLNWQGYVSKEELEKKFDGKIFHRYGIKWHTLRLRIQRLEKKKNPTIIAPPPPETFRDNQISKVQRCKDLLMMMASHAAGSHREKIEFYAQHDHETGVKLLEAIYHRLLVSKERPMGCPSRYINSSPIIAARILRDALH